MLQTTVVVRAADFASLRDEWLDLVKRSSSATIFDTYEWIWTWWEQIGSRAFGTRLFIITVRNSDHTLVGVAPLYTRLRLNPPSRQLSFLGAGVSDYHDIIAADGVEEEVVSSVFQLISASSTWDVADFNQLRLGGVVRQHSPPDTLSLNLQKLPGEKCPYIVIPEPGTQSSWDLLLRSYSKKTKARIRYYNRALDKIYTVDRLIADSVEVVKEGVGALFFLHQRRWNQRRLPGVFYNGQIRKFHSKVAIRLYKQGLLRLHIVKLDGAIEAVLYCYCMNGVTSYYQGGFEPTLSKRSLGSVATGLAIRQACEEGCTTFDFLRGDESYKLRWAGGKINRNQRWLLGNPRYILFPLFFELVKLEQRVELYLKRRLRGFTESRTTLTTDSEI